MDAAYERTLDRVSLVLKDDSVREADGFETRMVCVGGVPGLLPMSIRQMNGETAFVYDVTARQPLSEYLNGRLLNREELTQILETVLGILEELETYLLDADHLIFAADTIFAQGSFRDLRFCFVPAHSRPMREGFYGLVMELLSKADQEDRAAVILGYRFAHELQEINSGYSDLRACLYAGTGNGEEQAPDDASGIFPFAAGAGAEAPECAEGPGQKSPGSAEGLGQRCPGNADWLRQKSPGSADGSGQKSPQGADWLRQKSPGSAEGLGQKSPGSAGNPMDSLELREETGYVMREPSTRKQKRGNSGPAARLGINRRTILIILIGGAALLTAYLILHTEMAERIWAGIQKNSLFAACGLLALAAAGLILLRRKKAGALSGIFGGKEAFEKKRFADEEGNGIRAERTVVPWMAASAQSAGAYGGTAASVQNAGVYGGVASVQNPGVYRGAASVQNPGAYGGAANVQDPGAYGGTVASVQKPGAYGGGAAAAREPLVTCILAPSKEAAAAGLLPVREKELDAILLRKKDTLIGKQADLVDIVISVPVISRVHARVSRRGGDWYLTDLNSRNGTAVNNRLLESMKDVQLQNGDIVRFANLEYRFESHARKEEMGFADSCGPHREQKSI